MKPRRRRIQNRRRQQNVKKPFEECKTCPLASQPFVPSTGPEKTKFAVLGIAPHTTEVIQGKPFVGPSGKILNAFLSLSNLDRDEVFITNAVLCKPRGGRTEPTESEVHSCGARLKAEFAARGIERVLAMGRTPLNVAFPDTAQKLSNSRGTWQWSETLNCWALPTFHPAYLLHSGGSAFFDVQADVVKFADTTTPIPNRVPEVEYETLTTHEELQDLIGYLEGKESVVLDLETSNINMKDSTPNEWWDGYILCVAICAEVGKSFIISEKLFNSRKSLAMLKPLLERPEGWIGHNFKFDLKYFHPYYTTLDAQDPINIRIADDTFLMHYTLDERRGTHGLKMLTKAFDEPDYDQEFRKYLKRPKKDSYALVPRDILYRYAAKDADFTLRLFHIFKKKLIDANLYDWPYKNVILNSVKTLVACEVAGFHIDLENLAFAREKLLKEVEEFKQTLRDEGSQPDLNPNSPKQVSKILFDTLALPMPKGRNIKPGSTSKEVLLKLPQVPFVSTLRLYRRAAKLYGTYANKLDQYCDKNNFAHFEFNLTGSVTGRLEAGLLLTIPRAYRSATGKLIRNCFGARDGYTIIGADYSQAELRWLGWYSKEEFLYQVYEDGRDLHTEVAIAMYGEDFTKEERMYTKMFNFSYAYGGTEFSFAEDAGLPIEVAREWVQRYDRNMPTVGIWKKEIVATVKRCGILRTPTGRCRRFPLITENTMREIKNQAVNFPIQSVTNDSTLIAFVELHERFQREKLDVIPIIFMHDGFYLEVPDDPETIAYVETATQEKMLEVAYRIMTESKKLFPEFGGREPIKFVADVSHNKFWGEM